MVNDCSDMSLDLPLAFLERMRILLGDEYAAFVVSYDAPPSVGLRVNTLKLSANAFRAISPFDLMSTPWCPTGFVLPDEAAPGKHPYHAAGLYYLQDPSAMAVAELLDPQPGERILDLAAAPGGKTTHIAALMQGQGLLVANEIHAKRAWELAGNLERWGARNAAITNETPDRLAERFPGFFDRVLVDAPCSGEGMMRKGEMARREWSPELVHGCALRQTGILDQAAHMVRPGGRLVYSTCTFNPEENEGTIARFLARHTDFELIEPPHRPGFSPGRPDWMPAGTDLAPILVDAPALAYAVRLWPHRAQGEGHFIAVLRRAEDAAAPPLVNPWRPARLPRPTGDAYRSFCTTALKMTAACSGIEALAGRSHQRTEPPKGSHPDTSFSPNLALVGSYLYALPADLPDLTGLRYLHPGWWLGTIKKDRFEPAHALALGLMMQDAHRVLDLPVESADLTAYLRGETLASPGEDGWTLVAVDGYPIGWGKCSGGRLKSHYPKGLRRS